MVAQTKIRIESSRTGIINSGDGLELADLRIQENQNRLKTTHTTPPGDSTLNQSIETMIIYKHVLDISHNEESSLKKPKLAQEIRKRK